MRITETINSCLTDRSPRLIESLFVLSFRAYWGWQFAVTGWGKLHNLAKVTEFFTELHLPFPGLTADFIAGLEFLGGIALILGLLTRPVAMMLTVNMLVAYAVADREALASVFSDPDKFYAAAPFPFLIASAVILVIGPGLVSLDYVGIARILRTPVAIAVQSGDHSLKTT